MINLILYGLLTGTLFSAQYIARKYTRLTEVLGLIILLIIVYRTSNLPDFDNYENVYKAIGSGVFYLDTGIGWYFFCRLGNALGISYKIFSLIIVGISLVLIRSSIMSFIKSTPARCWIWGLYSVYPLLLDIVQLRFFLAVSLIIFALPGLIYNRRLAFINYLFFWLIAYTIHSSTLFYGIFLVIWLFNKFGFYFVLLLTCLGTCMFCLKNTLIDFFSNFINVARIERYLLSTNGVGYLGFFVYLGILIIFFLISWRLYEQVKRERNSEELRLCRFQCRMNLVMFLVLPLCLLDTDFIRLQRPMFLIMYISLINQSMQRRTIQLSKDIRISIKAFSVGLSILGLILMVLQQNILVWSAFLLS